MLEQLYATLSSAREEILDRARECALLTHPYIQPPDGFTETDRLPSPYQSFGAAAVASLSSKLTQSLLPTTVPFFKVEAEPAVGDAIDPQDREGLNAALAEYERRVQDEIEQDHDRVTIEEINRHLLISGNALLSVGKDGVSRVFGLEKFTIQRDQEGNPLRVIVRERFTSNTVSEDIREMANDVQILQQAPIDQDPQRSHTPMNVIDVYTGIEYMGKDVHIWQEVGGKEVPGSRYKRTKDVCEWVPLRMLRVSGEHYGRSYVEAYLGDLRTLEGLTQSVTQAAAAAAKVLFFVQPNALTSARAIADAENLAVLAGSADDVTVLQMQKSHDLSVALSRMEALEQRLGRAFLNGAQSVRDSERTTATELRLLAQELNQGLGGIYGLLAEELQLPFVRAKIANMVRRGKLLALPKSDYRIRITTGLDAVGRARDGEELRLVLESATQYLGPAVAQYLNVSAVLQRFADAAGADVKGLFKTDEEVQAEQQQAAMMQAAQSAAGPGASAAIRGGADLRKEQMREQQPA